MSSLSKESCLGSKGLKSRYLNTSFSMLCSSWGSGVHSLAPAPCLLASNVSHSLTGSSGFLLPAEQLQRSRAALARTALAPPRLCWEMWPGDAGERDSELSPTVMPCCVTEGYGHLPTSQAPMSWPSIGGESSEAAEGAALMLPPCIVFFCSSYLLFAWK